MCRWLDSSLSLTEQEVAEDSLLYLRFKYHSIADLDQRVRASTFYNKTFSLAQFYIQLPICQHKYIYKHINTCKQVHAKAKDSQKIKIKKKTKTPRITDEGPSGEEDERREKKEEKTPVSSSKSSLQV